MPKCKDVRVPSCVVTAFSSVYRSRRLPSVLKVAACDCSLVVLPCTAVARTL